MNKYKSILSKNSDFHRVFHRTRLETRHDKCIHGHKANSLPEEQCNITSAQSVANVRHISMTGVLSHNNYS